MYIHVNEVLARKTHYSPSYTSNLRTIKICSGAFLYLQESKRIWETRTIMRVLQRVHPRDRRLPDGSQIFPQVEKPASYSPNEEGLYAAGYFSQGYKCWGTFIQGAPSEREMCLEWLSRTCISYPWSTWWLKKILVSPLPCGLWVACILCASYSRSLICASISGSWPPFWK